MQFRKFYSLSGGFIARDDILKHQLLWMLLLRVVLYTLLLGITFFLGTSNNDIITLPTYILTLLLLTVYSISIVSAFYLQATQKHIRKFGFIQNLLDALFATILVYFTGISHSIFATIYFFPIISGGLILPRKGGIIAAAGSTLLYGSILLFEYNQVFPMYFLYSEYTPTQSALALANHFSVRGLTFFLAALLSALFGIRLKTTEEVLSNTIRSYDKLTNLHKKIFDHIATGIITTDENFIITAVNNATYTITGFTPESLIGKDITSTFPSLHLQDAATRLSSDLIKKDGSKIRVGYSLVKVQAPKPNEGTPNQDHFEADSNLITLQDISEIEKLEKQIRQGEKLAAIGMMSAGIAHDFRNPLTAISGSAQVLVKEFSGKSEKNQANFILSSIIVRESNRMISTIADFLKFARPERDDKRWFSLENCIQEVLQVCKADPSWPTTCGISIDLDENLDVWADEKQFFTVLSHLIQNALAFCPRQEEKIHIEAKEVPILSNKSISNIRISISDNGPGVPENLYDKIFEPFFTQRADGTGLGLAIVKQTMEVHQGRIELGKSEMGGAKFTLRLPIP
jgi:two-component system, NtrC family, sensor histidine kinase PilS